MTKEEHNTSLPIPSGEYQMRKESYQSVPTQSEATDSSAISTEVETRLRAESVDVKSIQTMKFQIDTQRELERRIFTKLNTRFRRLKKQ
jgi:hypothetical protein